MKLIKEIFRNTIIQAILTVMLLYSIIIVIIVYDYNNKINHINEINKYKIDSINKLIYNK